MKRYAAAVVEEAAEGELEEGVQRLVHVAELVVGGRGAQFIRVDGVEVRRIHRVLDLRYVRRRDAAHALLEVDAREERMLLHLVGVLAESTVGARAQLQYEVGDLRRDFRVLRYLQIAFPLDDLRKIRKKCDICWQKSVEISSRIRGTLPLESGLSLNYFERETEVKEW